MQAKISLLDLARAPVANDNHGGDEKRRSAGPARVTVPVGRPERAYAFQGNLILPLRFARRIPGWLK